MSVQRTPQLDIAQLRRVLLQADVIEVAGEGRQVQAAGAVAGRVEQTLMPWVLWSQWSTIAESGISHGNVLITVLALAAYVFGIARLILVLRAGATAIRVRAWQAQGVRLTEVYATRDPVPQGLMFDMTSKHHSALPSQEVHNRASWLGDHTSYWRNIEQVMLPLGLRIAAALGVPVDRLLTSDPQLLEMAVRRRIHRVRALVGLRSIALLGGVAVLWLEADALTVAASALVTWGQSLVGPTQASDPPLTQALLACVPAMAWIALPYAALVVAWRGWEVHEQRCFLLRSPPGTFVEMGLVAVMAAAAATPAGRSAALLWGDAGAGGAIAVIFVGSIFLAVFYVASLQVPKRAFGYETDKK